MYINYLFPHTLFDPTSLLFTLLLAPLILFPPLFFPPPPSSSPYTSTLPCILQLCIQSTERFFPYRQIPPFLPLPLLLCSTLLSLSPSLYQSLILRSSSSINPPPLKIHILSIGKGQYFPNDLF